MKLLRLIRVIVSLICMFYAGICFAQVPKLALPEFSSTAVRYSASLSSQISFVENKGQVADQHGNVMPEVLYSADANHMKCYLTASGMHFIFTRNISQALKSDIGLRLTPEQRHENLLHDTLVLQRLDMTFTGANSNPRIEAENISDGYYNYYLAHCKLTGVRGYKKITYHDLYPHIDFVIYSRGAETKYDFIVHPGGDPNSIGMRYAGMDSIGCTADGKFRVTSPLGVLEEDEPYSYQTGDEQTAVPFPFLSDG